MLHCCLLGICFAVRGARDMSDELLLPTIVSYSFAVDACEKATETSMVDAERAKRCRLDIVMNCTCFVELAHVDVRLNVKQIHKVMQPEMQKTCTQKCRKLRKELCRTFELELSGLFKVGISDWVHCPRWNMLFPDVTLKLMQADRFDVATQLLESSSRLNERRGRWGR